MNDLFEIRFCYTHGYGEEKVGILVGMTPMEWQSRNREMVTLLASEPVSLRDADGMEFVPLVITETPVHIDLM